MKHLKIISFSALIFASTPVGAQSDAPDEMPFLLRQGLEFMFRQMPPEVQGFRHLFDAPPLYEAPEVQPNGDIIIRRKRIEGAPLPKGQIEL